MNIKHILKVISSDHQIQDIAVTSHPQQQILFSILKYQHKK